MFNVLSFDHEKITTTLSADEKMIVRKRTVEMEHQNILLASKHLLKHQLFVVSEVFGIIRIFTAEIAEWDEKNKFLSTFYCVGENIEEILRKSIGSDRSHLIELIRKLFESFRINGFLWGDFAPRNMLWNQQRGVIWLVDFERDLILKDSPIEQSRFNRYIRNYSREEFSCFLTTQECALLFGEFLDEDTDAVIPASQLTSKRKRLLLKHLFSEKEHYALSEIRLAEDIMAMAATPFLVHDSYFFPMDSLDLIGSKGGANEYVQTITAIRDLEGLERFSELKRRTATL